MLRLRLCFARTISHRSKCQSSGTLSNGSNLDFGNQECELESLFSPVLMGCTKDSEVSGETGDNGPASRQRASPRDLRPVTRGMAVRSFRWRGWLLADAVTDRALPPPRARSPRPAG